MKKLYLYWYILLLILPLTAKAFDPLPAEQAFVLSTQFINNQQLQLNWRIAPGYHLYRDRFAFKLLNAQLIQLMPVVLPAGIPKEDDILGKYQVYQNNLALLLTLLNAQTGQYNLEVSYQGCADSGFCYPPVTKQIILTLSSGFNSARISNIKSNTAQHDVIATKITPPVASDEATALLTHHNWFFIFGGFLGFGLLLAFTPCVLPLLPILSTIIIGQGNKRTTARSFYLSLTYALAIALTYAGAGAIAALAGSYVQAFFQNPWVIGLFSLLFAVLSLSLFGLYELRLPASWNHYIAHLSQRQQGGTYVGVFLMGCFSVLIVSPCVSAPLIGTITYLSSTGDVMLGGLALFAMGLGMSIPLIIAGTFEGKWLPKSGPWLLIIKAFFGVLLLALAIWLLQRVIPGQLSMLLWAAFFIILALYSGALNKTSVAGWSNFWRGISIMLLIYGSALLIGALQGNTSPLQPLAVEKLSANQQILSFQPIKSISDLQKMLATAQAQHKPVLLDFYADWCVSCKIIDNTVFQQVRVQAALSDYLLLRADVTANDEQDKALQQYVNVIAPPTLIFYGVNGQEVKNSRIVGEISAGQFLQKMPAI